MRHASSDHDKDFQRRFQACLIPAADFDHRAHLRLAYIYLTEHDVDPAHVKMREALQRLLKHLGVDNSKYHDTITRAWILAVRHFMEKTPACQSADELIDQNPLMLNPSIMMTHYSTEQLHTDEARGHFVEPDLDPIPRYDD